MWSKIYCIVAHVFLFTSFPAKAQDCFIQFSNLKLNPSDSIALVEVLENCEQVNVIEQLILLKCFIALGISGEIKNLILTLTKYDIKEDYLNTIVTDTLWHSLNADTQFVKNLNLTRENKNLFFEADTVSKIVEEAYVLDQSIRRLDKLSKSKGGVRLIDSLVMIQLLKLLEQNKISTLTLGMQNEEKFYICLLHEMRYVNDQEFEKWDKLLFALVKSGNFNPYYYANIVDERLRYQESPAYPKYNFLRRIELNSEKEALIQLNRKKIKAY